MRLKLSNAEGATVLAALRYWQRKIPVSIPGDTTDVPIELVEYFECGGGPITDDQIDDLCERIAGC